MTTITRWNPFREFDDLLRANVVARSAPAQAAWEPAVDIVETDAEFRLLLDLPAVAPDSVSVAVDDGVLTVSGERVSPFQAENSETNPQGRQDADASAEPTLTRHRAERRFGQFSRSFRLPENVDEEAISAGYKEGVLTLSVGKRAQTVARKIEVQVH